MSHPMEPSIDATRSERDRLWRRRDEMERRLKTVSLAEFTFEQFEDLQLLADRSAVNERPADLEKAIDRLGQHLDRQAALKRGRRNARTPG